MTLHDRIFADSLWTATAAPAPLTPRLDGDSRIDVAIVGAGFLGLSLALHLAERGAQVCVLETHEPGFGASGRNTGFVVPAFSGGVGPDEAVARLGPDYGERLSRFIGRAGDDVFGLIQRHAIACDAEPNGWMSPVATPEGVAFLERRHQAWRRVGKALELLDRATTQRLSGSSRYFGALMDRSGGQINPLGYARGLAAAALRAGAAIHGQTRVAAIESVRQGWRLVTAGGAVTASRIVLATNALVGPLAPLIARSLIPIRTWQVASTPLDADAQRAVLPERHCVTDFRRNVMAYRLTADGRLLTGGIVATQLAARTRAPRYFLGRVSRHLDCAPPLEPAHVWMGVIAVTRDLLPKIMTIGPGAYAVIGCNGRGIAMTTALGRAMAEYLSRDDPDALPVPISQPAPIAGHAFARAGPSLWLSWSRSRDWLDARRVRRARRAATDAPPPRSPP
jgi:glycine/D-amino acid oxidase-like deaminating enzyme